MSYIAFIHGFNEHNDSKERMIPLMDHDYFNQFNCINCAYGDFGIGDVISKNDTVAKTLASSLPQGCYLVGHSNGCAIAYRIIEQRPDIKLAVFINPALEEDIEIPSSIDNLLVLHNKQDMAVKAAGLANAFIPGNSFIWGSMGRDGYQGKDPRVKNINMTYMCDELHPVKPHNAAVQRENHKTTASIIVDFFSQGFFSCERVAPSFTAIEIKRSSDITTEQTDGGPMPYYETGPCKIHFSPLGKAPENGDYIVKSDDSESYHLVKSKDFKKSYRLI